MNCNKKSHFDGVTPVHRRMGGGVGGRGVGWGREGFGYVSVCKEEVLSQALEKQREKGGMETEREEQGEKESTRELHFFFFRK